ncbi:hypothetical protein BpHYR1_027660 [Brachionus plicatilis]|uniref:Uncharacterized protein n=1 Tax=Brachionus plicatilis TaxID=10195 RepID=A0A3M7S3V3_BRAPC|nr:hypothetical protein BpHYR1_027660 [Brachionus plicatilis]
MKFSIIENLKVGKSSNLFNRDFKETSGLKHIKLEFLNHLSLDIDIKIQEIITIKIRSQKKIQPRPGHSQISIFFDYNFKTISFLFENIGFFFKFMPKNTDKLFKLTLRQANDLISIAELELKIAF